MNIKVPETTVHRLPRYGYVRVNAGDILVILSRIGVSVDHDMGGSRFYPYQRKNLARYSTERLKSLAFRYIYESGMTP
ncbi:MAG: hypothetical protein H0X04_00330 [Chthoniobacterales bacterium]|nr:hypothetical protein [Chthoniobacterales bacterium]